MAKSKLFIKKNIRFKSSWLCETVFTFPVIDLDRGSYPNCWFCNLPKASSFKRSHSSRLFYADPVGFVVELLMLVKQEYLDKNIQKEIDLRILKFKETFFEFLPEFNTSKQKRSRSEYVELNFEGLFDDRPLET